MIKNINDFLSVATIIVIACLAMKYFLGALFSMKNEKENVSRAYLLRHYTDNEDE